MSADTVTPAADVGFVCEWGERDGQQLGNLCIDSKWTTIYFERPCRTNKTQQACDSDADCMWDATKNKCMGHDCKKLTDPCDCKSDPLCYWDSLHGAGAAKCVDANYAQCGTMDVVVILDGTTSMGDKFGRQPNGQVAVIEILRHWIASLPLTGECHW